MNFATILFAFIVLFWAQMTQQAAVGTRSTEMTKSFVDQQSDWVPKPGEGIPIPIPMPPPVR